MCNATKAMCFAVINTVYIHQVDQNISFTFNSLKVQYRARMQQNEQRLHEYNGHIQWWMSYWKLSNADRYFSSSSPMGSIDKWKKQWIVSRHWLGDIQRSLEQHIHMHRHPHYMLINHKEFRFFYITSSFTKHCTKALFFVFPRFCRSACHSDHGTLGTYPHLSTPLTGRKIPNLSNVSKNPRNPFSALS